jgi:hypothetical protein
MSLAFLACIERGPLEAQTALLCRSIRRYGGRFRDAPIHVFQPRAGHDIATATARVLDELGVVVRTEVLNVDFAHYPVGNKVFACARAEATLDEDMLVFLDSDTIFTAEPAEFDFGGDCDCDAAIRPAHSVGHNCSGPGHPMDPYWRRVYDLLGIEDECYVETELGTITRAYFSAGLIAVRRRAGLFARWRSDFLGLTAAGCLPASGIARADEISLAATMLRAMDRVKILDGRYNYLIFKRGELPPPWDGAQLEDLVHVHYRRKFAEPGFLDRLRPPIREDSAVRRWLEPFLPLTNPVD